MGPSRWGWIMYFAFAILTYFIVQVFEPLAFILFAPFVVVERYGTPHKDEAKIGRSNGTYFCGLGGLCRMLAFEMIVAGQP